MICVYGVSLSPIILKIPFREENGGFGGFLWGKDEMKDEK